MGTVYNPPKTQDILGPYNTVGQQPTVQRMNFTGNEGEGTALGMFATSFLEGLRQSRLQKMQQQENALIRNVKLAEADLNAIMSDENLSTEAKEQARQAYQQYIGTALATNTQKAAKKNPVVGFIDQFAQGLLGGKVPDKATQSDPNEFFRLTSELRTNPAYSMKTRREEARRALGDAYSQIMQGDAGPYTTLNDALQDEKFRTAFEAAQNAGLNPLQDARIVFAQQPRSTEESILRQRAIDNYRQMKATEQQERANQGQPPAPGAPAAGQPSAAPPTGIAPQAGAAPPTPQVALTTAQQVPPGVPGAAAQGATPPGAPAPQTNGRVTLRPLAAPQPTKLQLEQAKMTGRTTFETFYDPVSKQPVTLMMLQDKLGQWDGAYNPETGQRIDIAGLSKDVPKGPMPPDPAEVDSNKQLIQTILQGAESAGIIKSLDAKRLLGTANSQIERGQYDRALNVVNQYIASQEAAMARSTDRKNAQEFAGAMKSFGKQMQQANFALNLDKSFDSSPVGKSFNAVSDSLGRAKSMIEMALVNPRAYDTAQVHSAILTAFAKMQDPNSVVRPSEFDEAAKTLGYLNYNFNRIKGELEGRGNTRMRPEDMQKFLHVMETAAKIGYQGALKKAERFTKIGGMAGINIDPRGFSAIQNFEEMFPNIVDQVEAEKRMKKGAPPSRPAAQQATPGAQQQTPGAQSAPPVNPNSPEAKLEANPFPQKNAPAGPALVRMPNVKTDKPLQGVF